MGGVNIARATLISSKFGEACLVGANLNRSDLSRARFRESDLSNANMEFVDLSEAVLLGAKFYDANLRQAKLGNSNNLIVAQLAGANLSGTILPEAVARFEINDAAVRTSSHARKQYTPLILSSLLLCVLSYGASSQEPVSLKFLAELKATKSVIGAIGSVIIALWYFYFLHYMASLWKIFTKMPAIYPNEEPLYRYPDSWFIINIIRKYLPLLKKSDDKLQVTISSAFLWFAVPTFNAIILFFLSYSNNFISPFISVLSFAFSVELSYSSWKQTADSLLLIDRTSSLENYVFGRRGIKIMLKSIIGGLVIWVGGWFFWHFTNRLYVYFLC